MACPLCDDTGWKPIDDDGVRRVTRCDCWRAKLGDTLLADAHIPRRYQHCDLATFITYPNERLLNVVKRTKRFADEFPVVEKGLFFVGPPGIGKTHLAVAVLRQVVQTTGARGIFYDTRDLLRVIRSTYDPVSSRDGSAGAAARHRTPICSCSTISAPRRRPNGSRRP